MRGSTVWCRLLAATSRRKCKKAARRAYICRPAGIVVRALNKARQTAAETIVEMVEETAQALNEFSRDGWDGNPIHGQGNAKIQTFICVF